MARDWEAQFRDWAKPLGKTEQERCDNAASAIRNAIKASDKLRSRGVSVFAQGSYRNNTNVRKDSDVDIGVPPTTAQCCSTSSAPRSRNSKASTGRSGIPRGRECCTFVLRIYWTISRPIWLRIPWRRRSRMVSM